MLYVATRSWASLAERLFSFICQVRTISWSAVGPSQLTSADMIPAHKPTTSPTGPLCSLGNFENTFSSTATISFANVNKYAKSRFALSWSTPNCFLNSCGAVVLLTSVWVVLTSEERDFSREGSKRGWVLSKFERRERKGVVKPCEFQSTLYTSACSTVNVAVPHEGSGRRRASPTYRLKVPWDLAETRETIPDLTDQGFPDLGFHPSSSFFRSYFSTEYAFG